MHLVTIGEIFLKGKNRITFERKLIRNIREGLELQPNELLKFRNKYLILNDKNINKIKTVFGIVSCYNVIEIKKEELNDRILSMISNEKTFRLSCKNIRVIRENSQLLNQELGSLILSKKPDMKVDLEKPEINIIVEELNNKIFLSKHSDIIKCLGGLPVGSSGFVYLRVNNITKSTVAGFLMLKRGCKIILSKDLPLLHKFAHGFLLKVKEEYPDNFIVTDEAFKELNFNEEEDRFILRPLVGLSNGEINNLYKEITNL